MGERVVTGHPQVSNDVYERYGLRWADFPRAVTPSAHSDEAELFCARQSLAVYGLYPNKPDDDDRDYIASRYREAIRKRTFNVRQMIRDPDVAEEGSYDSPRGYRTVVTDQAGALMVWQDLRLIIAFRGTANWQDWIHNFTGTTIAPDYVAGDFEFRLHKGFYGLASNIFPAVAQLIDAFVIARKAKGREVELTLCGHSLGGALALNFGSIWQSDPRHQYFIRRSLYSEDIPRLCATYTFGAPRLGSGEIWRAVSRPHYRLIVRGDPVPAMPFGCAEDFQAAFLEKPASPAAQPKSVFAQIWKAATTKMTRHIPDFGAHDIESYIEAIEAKITAKTQTP